MLINKTTEYSVFKKHSRNREIDKCNLKKIIGSIEANNMLHMNPIKVNSNMEVIDGQHRLKAAEALGVAIYYQKDPSSKDEDIVLLNTNQKGWVIEDYINYHAAGGNPEYVRFKAFWKNNGLKCSIALGIAGIDRGGSALSKLKKGIFTFTEQNESQSKELVEKGRLLLDWIRDHKIGDIAFLNFAKFRKAYYSFLENPDVDYDTFCQKIKIKVDLLRSCMSAEIYYELFKSIYNWKNSAPVI